MGLPIIPKGADEVIEVTLQDGDGNAINPNSCLDVIVSVYQTKQDIVQQWKKSDDQMTVIGGGTTGKVRVGLDGVNTAKLPEARLYLEVCIVVTNTLFEGGEQRQIATDISMADIKNSVTE